LDGAYPVLVFGKRKQQEGYEVAVAAWREAIINQGLVS